MESWPAVRVPELPGRAPEPMVWDTASGGLAEAARDRRATIYACGITPYDATHIGHAATYTAWDLLVRAWRDAGHDVRYVQNVTDVDDPLLERAARDGDDWRELADREIDRYRSDMAALRLLPPDHLIGAVEALDLIESFSGLLADRGSLYELDGDVYFCRSADASFGSVSRLDVGNMIKLSAERGGDPGRAGKKDPLDPLVWLARKPDEPSWDSRFGQGRPGWHVECAAIATRYLGEAFDVQAGGSDLIFPHHEMSASHARVALGGAGCEVFARRYAHAGMVRLGGEKMSKSLGNLVFVSALRESGTDPMAIRLAVLAHHYREDWDWTDEGLAAAARRLERWRTAVRTGLAGSAGLASLATEPGPAGPGESVPSDAARAVLSAIRKRMADDLDAPGALAVVDAFADQMLAASPADAAVAADRPASARLVRDAVDALLGVAL
ncbi:MAG TPA: cysteine--1-D-myo-inosityl 2-amino-2-deoxy-alpha-D-glucopyranoside ligase [Streptosporangiaceae bacterium]|nr:cysteine--1-D-myo-inosityl 2-amino-2-deoxy-alpha-D-glucopyranoside ligase [Streptosporangiaceae bacterium]